MRSRDNFGANTISQEMLFIKLIIPGRKIMKEMAKFVSDCLDKRAQSISALATNSYLKILKNAVIYVHN